MIRWNGPDKNEFSMATAFSFTHFGIFFHSSLCVLQSAPLFQSSQRDHESYEVVDSDFEMESEDDYAFDDDVL